MPIEDDNAATRGLESSLPDPHGQAALLLVESLIHGLLERSIITTRNAIEIVEAADSIQVEVAEAADGKGAPMWESHALLSTILQSLKVDVGGPPPLRPVP